MAEKSKDRFALSRNFLATDETPDTLFGIPVVADRSQYTPEDLAFFRKHPEAGGYYDMGDDEEGAPEEPPMQAASKGGKPKPIVKGPLHYGPPPPPSRGKYPGIANNPGNVEKHERRTDKTLFKGEIAGGVRPKRFANFSDPVDGLTAAAAVLSRRAASLAEKGLPFTIENYVPGYAPKSENDVEGYIGNLSRYSGFARDEELDPGNVEDMAKLLRNVVRFESGVPNSEWFTDDEYRQAALAMQEGAVD